MKMFTCMVALALFFSSVVMCIVPPMHIQNFKEVVNEKQWATYENIAAERLNIYVRSLLLGLIVGYVYSALVKKSNICQVTALILMVTSFMYTISPKSKYMIEDLNTPQQREAWLDVYNEQKLKGHVSAMIGFIVIPLYSYLSNLKL